MTAHTLHPARTLDAATPALNFEEPLDAGDARYVDLSPLRGHDSRRMLRRLFERKQGGTFGHLAIVSHRGAGKTTELHQLAHELRGRYEPVYLAANVELDPIEFSVEDLLLVLCREVVQRMQAWGLPIDAERLQAVHRQLADIVRTTSAGRAYLAELKGGAQAAGPLAFLGLTGHLTALNRQETQDRTEVRERLRQFPGALMEAVNQLLEQARRALKAASGRELLLIIDNLDRYDPEVMDRVLVQQGDRFRELRVDLLVTPPIALLYRPLRGDLTNAFQVEVMPSVRLHGPDERDYRHIDPPARELLLGALGRRIDLDALVPDPAARDRLLVGSGGSIRELLELAQSASLFADDRIDADAVERAIQRRKAALRDLINANGWAPTLALISRSRQARPAPGPQGQQHLMEVLYRRMAFKYNGEGWYDVHPLVAELPELTELRVEEGG